MKDMEAFLLARPNIIELINAGCKHCDFKRYVYVPNGLDDVDAEPCGYCIKDI